MVLEMIKRYIKSIIYSVILLGLLGVPLSVAAQQELTREERINLLEAGAEDFILKPFNPMELKARIKKFL